jgi:hypothetical protein
MQYNDNSYGLFQGSLFLQKRALNGAAQGGFVAIGDADKFEISVAQTFDDIKESQSGLRSLAAHIPTGTEIKLKINALFFSQAVIAAGLWGTDTGAVAAGTVAAELINAYNNSMQNLANIGASSVVVKTAGLTGTIAAIAVTAAGSGYTPNALLPLTITGAPGTGATGFAVTNAAGAITGAYAVARGTGYAAPTATVTTPGAGSGATFAVTMGAVTLAAGTDYTLDSVYGTLTFLPGSVIVPAFSDVFSVAAPGVEATPLTVAYSYAAYTGKVEAMTTGAQYFSLRLQGTNLANQQPVVIMIYQTALDMAKILSMIDAKHNSIELDGMAIQDTTKALPTLAAPYSQFFNVTKA